MFSLRKLVRNRPLRFGSERGLTLTELLVSMILLIIIVGVSLAVLLSTTASSSRFGQNTANQTEVANAINIINRDIVAANAVTYAGNSALALSSTENNQQYNIKVFGWSGSTVVGSPGGFTVDTTRGLPAYPAIIEQRQQVGGGAVTQNILVPGWAAASQTSLFTYYDGADAQLSLDSSNKVAAPKTIKRIEFFIAARINDRTSNLELAGSAVPRSFNTVGGDDPDFPAYIIGGRVATPVLSGTLPEKSTTATLTWTIPAGATSYTLYRKEAKESGYTVLAIIPDPDTTQYLDKNLTLGNTYNYYIVALGPGGTSPNSNGVALTVVPPKVTIVNINTTAGLGTTYNNESNGTLSPRTGSAYTVARNLTDQISWAPANGATGYYIYKDGNPLVYKNITDVSNASKLYYQDSAAYGETHTYRVEAYNVNSYNCDGVCDGDLSDPVTLISPPTAPSIDAASAWDHSGVKDRDQQPYNRVWLTAKGTGGAVNYTNLYASASGPGGLGDCTLDTNTDTNTDVGPNTGSWDANATGDNVAWGSSTCYGARAGNDAGLSPLSNTVRANYGPSSFSVVNVNSTAPLVDGSGRRYTVARDNTNQITWNESYGATGYRIYRDGGYVTTLAADQRVWSESASNGDTHSYYVQAFTSGANRSEQSYNSNTVTLVSPPQAPVLSVAADDSSTGSKSRNDVTVTSRPANTAAIAIYRTQVAGSIGSDACNTSNTLTDNAGATTADTGADWGSDTCYVAYARNDAGTSPASNRPVAEQKPSRFSYTQLANSQHYVASWVNGTSGFSLKNADSPSRNQSLSYDMAWSTSSGARKYNLTVGYNDDNPASSNRIESWSGNGHSMCGGDGSAIQAEINSQMPQSSVDNSTCFVTDGSNSSATSFNTSNLSPGSFYRTVTVAVGNNGLVRGASSDFVTTATAPQYAAIYNYKRQVDNASKDGTPYMARVAVVGIETSIGTSTSVRAFEGWNDSVTTAGYGNNSPSWYSRASNQGSNSYLRVRTPGLAAQSASEFKNTAQCKQVTNGYCHVFNTDYDSDGASHTTKDMTAAYNPSWETAKPTRYQFGNFNFVYDNGGAQSLLSSDRYNYSGYSDQMQWYSSMPQTNCFYRACNKDDSDVTSGSNSGPWAGYPNNEFVPNGLTAHDYYYMSPTNDTNPGNDSNGKKGSPPDYATRQYATGDATANASTADGTLPDNNVASND